jgi:predicted esterase
MATPDPDPTLSLPRILCIHGGGVNASIFRAQFRAFLSHPRLKDRYRFVFVDAPFFCDEGVGVHPVYSAWGPFRRWFRWLDSHPAIEPSACQYELEYTLERCMSSDEGTGEWVATLGFSQGAKLACSLLYEQQISERAEGPWKYAVILAGRAPLVSLCPEAEEFPWMQSAGGLADQADTESILERPDMKLRLPTLHVHGLKDEGLHLHRALVQNYCAPGTASLVEWDGPHRIPIKKSDVDRIVDAWIELADEYGV